MDIIEKYKQFTFSNLDDWELELIKKYQILLLHEFIIRIICHFQIIFAI